MLPGLVVDPYESRVVEAVRYSTCMPVVTLTDPSIADVPVVGACRFTVQPDTEWQEFVAEVLQGASLIVVDLTKGVSQGLESEIEMICGRELMSRTIFVIGPTGEQRTTAIYGFNTVEATNAGARVLSHAVFEEGGLSEFIDAVEDIRHVYTEWERVSESMEDEEKAVLLDRKRTEKFQDPPPDIPATCPACGHTWMGNWDISFKDRQCPQCRKRWKVGVSDASGDPRIGG
jgi:rubrerythrin